MAQNILLGLSSNIKNVKKIPLHQSVNAKIYFAWTLQLQIRN